MSIASNPLVDGEFWYIEAESLPEGLQSKLRERSQAGYREPRPVSPNELRRLDSEVVRLEDRARQALLDRADPSHIRHLKDLVKHTKSQRLESISGESPDALVVEFGRWSIIAAPFVAMASFAALAAKDAGFPTAVVVPVVLAAFMVGLPFLLRPSGSLALSGAELTLIREATRSIRISDRNRAVALLRKHERPRDAADLVAIAAHLGELVTTSPAWTSRYLESHRSQFDVHEEVRQIARNAAKYHTMLQRLKVAPTGATRTAELASTAQDRARQQLSVVWTTLQKRVDALAEFSSHIKQLEIELHNAELTRQALDMDDDLAELMASSAANEIAASQLRHMSDQAEGLTLAIHELVDQLHADLQTLRALAPSA
ncbi:hypothetical protein ACFVUS_29910 [Nocardia sp. NPDC058058]|uniref:hypothetical protein n=1 Tax=Nocardia sp. NPDC058058 TaxID=3346317 RepID=UPI0036DE86BE